MQSDWDLTLSTLQRIDQGIRICNEALFNADFGLWLRGLYHLYGELSPFLTLNEHTEALTYIDKCKTWQGKGMSWNLDNFMIATTTLRKLAHKHKLLIREAEDTSKHGGTTK